MNKLKIKIITGYRADQHRTIDSEEAHKAYWLFLNPDRRAIFNDGHAIVGADIRGIEPDYHATIGWNPSHTLDSDDWNELRQRGIDTKLRDVLYEAKMIAQKGDPQLMALPLSEAKTKLLT